MDVQPITNVEPSHGPQTNPEMSKERPTDCGNLDLANHLQRIVDLRADAYQNPNSSLAVLRFQQSDLAEIAARISYSVLELLRGRGLATEDSDLKMSAIDQLIRLAKQNAEMMELENRLSSVESVSNSKKLR